MKIFNTLADLQAARFASTGQLVQVKGTDTTGDGGIDFFLIQNSGTPDGVDVFATAGSKVAVRQKGAKASLLAGRAKFTDTTQFATGTTTEGVVANDATWLSLVGTTITVETQGFHSGSTVGGAKYKFLNAADSTAQGYVTGYSRFQIRSLDVYACLVVSSEITPLVFGAVGDGVTDDTLAFSLAALKAGNNSVLSIPTGRYKVGLLELPNDNLIITGGGTIVKSASAKYGLGISGGGVQLNGIIFEGEATSGQPNTDLRLLEGCSNVRVMNCTFKGNGYSAITAAEDVDYTTEPPYTSPVTGIIISNCIFMAQTKGSATYARPLYMTSTKNLTITGNVFRDTDFDAIRLRTDTGETVISNNQFKDIGNPTAGDEQTRDCIDTAFDTELLVISDNVMINTAYRAIDIKSSTSEVSYKNKKIIIKGNVIEGTHVEAVSITAPAIEKMDTISITDNIITKFAQSLDSVGDAGVYVSAGGVRNMLITNNQISNGKARGVYLQPSGDGILFTTIRGNHIVNTSNSGIYLSSNTRAIIITENMIVNDPNVDNYNAMTHGIQAIVYNDTFNAQSIMSNNVVVDTVGANIVIGNTGFAGSMWGVLSNNIEIGANAYTDNPRVKAHRRIMHGTSIPLASDGSFNQGDIIFHAGIQDSTGQPAGWICTASGNPGTWRQFATTA